MTRFTITLSLLLLIAQQAEADVSLTDSGRDIVIRNESISMTFEKSTGRATELVHDGTSLLAPGQAAYFTMRGSYDDDSETVYVTDKERSSRSKFQRQEKCTYTVHRNTPEMVDVSFTPEQTAGYPFAMELHYVLRKGDSGFYFYIIAKKPEQAGKAWLTQLRFGMRVDDSMTNIRLTDELFGTIPDSEMIKNAKGKVMDATYVLQSGEMITKYDWACLAESVPVYGLSNGRRGVWIVTGGNEYLNGGPTKQHNTCHATDRGPILLKLMYSNHFGSRGSYIEGDWQKIYGPVFVYMNKGESEQTLWADAKKRAARVQQSWPCQWLENPLYPTARARVMGRFQGIESAAPVNGWVVLAEPTERRQLDWQQQGADTYIYRAPIKADGSFEIPAVREGTYTLYAFADNVVGEYRMDGVQVGTSVQVDLGSLNWKYRTNGKLLWRIGTPDRTAKEFRHGDDYRHWGIWFDYEKEFPEDFDFVIGKSDELRLGKVKTKNWNYAHTLIWESPDGWKPELLPINDSGDGTWRAPTRKIRFESSGSLKGQATLTIGIAGSGQGALAVGLNGKPLNDRIDLKNDSSIARSGIHGRFREKIITFDASWLHNGENTITLDLKTSAIKSGRRNYPPFGILYDYIQLEVKCGASASP